MSADFTNEIKDAPCPPPGGGRTSYEDLAKSLNAYNSGLCRAIDDYHARQMAPERDANITPRNGNATGMAFSLWAAVPLIALLAILTACLVWSAPHCRSIPAHQHYVELEVCR